MSSIAFLPSAYQSVQVTTRSGNVVKPSVAVPNRPNYADVLTLSPEAKAASVGLRFSTSVGDLIGQPTEENLLRFYEKHEQALWAMGKIETTVEMYYEDTLAATRTITRGGLYGITVASKDELVLWTGNTDVSSGGTAFTPEWQALRDKWDTDWAKWLDGGNFNPDEWYDPDKITYKATSTWTRADMPDEWAKIPGFTDWLAEKPTTKIASAYEGEDIPLNYGFSTGEWETGTRLNTFSLYSIGPVIRVDGRNNTGINNDIGIFQQTANPYAGLSTLLGLEEVCKDKDSLISALDKLINDESAELNKLLSGKLKAAGLQDVTKKITFAEDADGNIVIKGNISAAQKKKLAKLINDDPALVDRIKTQKARMEIAEELKKGGEIDKETGKTHQTNLNDKKFDAARTQLLKDFLEKNNLSINNLNDALNENLDALLTEFPELKSEIVDYKYRQKAAKTLSAMHMPGVAGEESDETEDGAVRSLFSMKRGVLSEVTDEDTETNLRTGGMELRSTIYKRIVDKFNDLYKNDWESQISSFGMKIDNQGRLSIVDAETSGDDPQANAIATKVMNTWLNMKIRDQEDGESDEDYAKVPTIREVGQELGLAILDAHDDEHGDVKEFRHEIVFGKGFGGGFEVLSPDADRAALQEMEVLSQEIDMALGQFFGKTMSPLSIMFGEDGLLSLGKDGMLSHEDSQAIQKVLDEINHYLLAERNGEETEGMLSPELTGIAGKLLELKDAQDKIHDKSLLPKEGIRFSI